MHEVHVFSQGCWKERLLEAWSGWNLGRYCVWATKLYRHSFSGEVKTSESSRNFLASQNSFLQDLLRCWCHLLLPEARICCSFWPLQLYIHLWEESRNHQNASCASSSRHACGLAKGWCLGFSIFHEHLLCTWRCLLSLQTFPMACLSSQPSLS